MQIPVFIIPLTVWAIIQVIKLIIDKIKWEKIDFNRLFVSGWFPSVHSGLSTSVLVSVAYIDWIYSTTFAMALVFSILFRYDAANVRYQAWKHAEIINKMRNQLSNVLEIEIKKSKLKERLWHTFGEVIGGIIISALLTIAVIYLFNIYWIKIK